MKNNITVTSEQKQQFYNDLNFIKGLQSINSYNRLSDSELSDNEDNELISIAIDQSSAETHNKKNETIQNNQKKLEKLPIILFLQSIYTDSKMLLKKGLIKISGYFLTFIFIYKACPIIFSKAEDLGYIEKDTQKYFFTSVFFIGVMLIYASLNYAIFYLFYIITSFLCLKINKLFILIKHYICRNKL